ncbi:helix-turn-helix transcriptional regulator [Nostoc sp. DedSLP04]|uniref:helix-turn-helix transcriptional regulator n=1 Tax=Nostoc sp. DedSLP04 TaxID=3075401 RepID=UPI002AD48A58|nr:helix-turn-helix transcriptional regulator [Nostoc sp. DedSLP04]MDZ8033462.1 helix-turn-helix transcriptional regulator [Nostoc sp. DedSLP04]
MEHMKAVSRLAILREKENLTQRQLADLLEITENTVANWETGRSSVEWIDRVVKLCKIFACTPEELIEYVADTKPVKTDSLAEIRARLNPPKSVSVNQQNRDQSWESRAH